MELLSGKSAIVTGAARGIGRAIAEEFVRQGANVLLLDLDEETGTRAAASLSAGLPGRALFLKVDVARETEVDLAFEHAAAEFGHVDILVNNAAVLLAHEVKDFPLSEWKRVFDVNVNGPFLCARAAVNHMIPRGIKGVILNVASASSRKADAKHAAYSASKAAVIAFARVLALEVGHHGIRVNCLLPGATQTEMLEDVFSRVPGLREDIIRKTVLNKLGQPKDQANAAVFLCSDMASHVTGEYLIVSGGEFFNP